MKGGVALMLLNLIVNLAKVLVAVTVCDGLVVPTLTLPKARLAGLTISCAEAGVAAASPIEKRRKKLRTENVKMDNFDRNMVIPPMNSATDVCISAHRQRLLFPAILRTSIADMRLVRLITSNARRRKCSN
jgi:hypothetical protein